MMTRRRNEELDYLEVDRKRKIFIVAIQNGSKCTCIITDAHNSRVPKERRKRRDQ